MSEKLTDEELAYLLYHYGDPQDYDPDDDLVRRAVREVEALRSRVAQLEAERWPIPGTEGDERYTARVLLGRVVYARADKARRIRSTTKHHALAWSSVRSVVGIGSGYAAALCRVYGFDPDTGEREGGSDE